MDKKSIELTVKKRYPTASKEKVKLVVASICDAKVASDQVVAYVDMLMNFKSGVSNIGNSESRCPKCRGPMHIVKSDETRLCDYCPLCRVTLPKPIL